MMGEGQKCLICYNEDRDPISTFPSTSEKLESQLSVIYILGNLLGVSSHVLQRLLRTRGNPSKWGIDVCSSCRKYVKEAEDIRKQMSLLQKKLRDLKKRCVKKIVKSMSKEEDEKNRKGQESKRSRSHLQNKPVDIVRSEIYNGVNISLIVADAEDSSEEECHYEEDGGGGDEIVIKEEFDCLSVPDDLETSHDKYQVDSAAESDEESDEEFDPLKNKFSIGDLEKVAEVLKHVTKSIKKRKSERSRSSSDKKKTRMSSSIQKAKKSSLRNPGRDFRQNGSTSRTVQSGSRSSNIQAWDRDKISNPHLKKRLETLSPQSPVELPENGKGLLAQMESEVEASHEVHLPMEEYEMDSSGIQTEKQFESVEISSVRSLRPVKLSDHLKLLTFGRDQDNNTPVSVEIRDSSSDLLQEVEAHSDAGGGDEGDDYEPESDNESDDYKPEPGNESDDYEPEPDIDSDDLTQGDIIYTPKSSKKTKQQNKTKRGPYKVKKDIKCNFVCNECGRKFVTNLSLASHKRMSHSKLHKCKYCEKTFSTRPILMLHVQRNHDEEKIFKCDACPVRYFTSRQLIYHQHDAHGIPLPRKVKPKQRDCEVCGKTYASTTCLGRHMASAHPDEWEQKGEQMYNQMKNKLSKAEQQQLEDATVNTTRNECKECDIVFKTADNLKKHFLKSLKHMKDVMCKYCQEKFNNRSSLMLHIKANHADQKEFKCEFCPKTFETKYSFFHHRNWVHEISLPKNIKPREEYCEICGKSLASKTGLINHMATQHPDVPTRENESQHDINIQEEDQVDSEVSNEKTTESKGDTGVSDVRFNCRQCGQICKSSGSLRAHIIMVHVHSSTSGKKIVCKYCGEEFERKTNLMHHMKISHLLEKEHMCEKCPKTFQWIYSLQLHQRNAHGIPLPKNRKIREKVCELCGKTLAQKFSLARHMAFVHGHGDKKLRPFKCQNPDFPNCTFSARTSLELNRHNMYVHQGVTRPESIPKRCPAPGCSKVYKCGQALKRHMVHVHGNTLNTVVAYKPPVVYKPYSRHPCPKCRKIYMIRKSLLMHLNKDHGENHYIENDSSEKPTKKVTKQEVFKKRKRSEEEADHTDDSNGDGLSCEDTEEYSI